MPDAKTAPARAATVEFDHVTKSYDAKAAKAGAVGAVNDLSLTIPAGKICVLVGPSGCGKTTSLKMVNRLIEPTTGRILLDGVDVATRDVTELRRGIGYVIQQTGLFPHQTIEDNVATVPRLLGWPKARQRERADELLDLVGLPPARCADRYPAQLSGGERQRVGVARALAADPPVMLMDEPFGAVDPIVRERLQNEFLRLQEQLAKTILFVTHDIDEAIKMGDVVAVFRAGGVVEQFGTPEEILASPATPFVARFVGADRGLKRLSLTRVTDLELESAATAHVGEEAAQARRRVTGARPRYLLLWMPRIARSGGWTRAGSRPPAARGGPGAAVVAPARPTHDAQGRPLDAAGERHPDRGRRGPPRRLPRRDRRAADRGLHARHGPSGRGAGRRGPDGRGRVIDWTWVVNHLDELVARTDPAPAVHRGRRRARLRDLVLAVPVGGAAAARLRPDHRRRRDPVHHPEPRPVRRPRADHRAVHPHRDHPARAVHDPHPRPEHGRGFDAVPADVNEAADGMGYTGRQRLRAVELPLALPLIVAGVRVASVSTIGLVTITGALGDRFGGLGFFIFEGYRRRFPTEILFGAIPAMILAIAVDLSLVAAQGRLSPWSRAHPDMSLSTLDTVTPDAMPGGAAA